MPDTNNRYGCDICKTSFSSHEALIHHNINAHGAALGAQLRQSEEIQKQRAHE